MNPRRTLAAAAMMIAAGLAAAAELSNRDEEYLRDRARTLIADVQAGQLASKQGSTDQVRAFAFRMVADHERALENVRKLAAARGIELPSAPTDREQRAVDKLTRLRGIEFDEQFMERAIRSHKAGIKADQKRLYGTKDPDLRALVSASHDTETAHLALANRALGSVPAK